MPANVSHPTTGRDLLATNCEQTIISWSGAAKSDGAVAGVNAEGLAAAIELTLNVRAADAALDGDGEGDVYVAVAGRRVEVGLEALREGELNAAVASADAPGRSHPGAGMDA